MLRDGKSVGAISVGKAEPIPFSERQIQLLSTFAEQAVIGVKNVRLFGELQARTRGLSESLKQQTGTAEILSVISNSLTDTQPHMTRPPQSNGDAAAEAARKFGLEPRQIELKDEQGYAGAFRAMDDAPGQPIILPAGPTFLRDREASAQALLERRISVARGISREHGGRRAHQLWVRPDGTVL
jgi:hypothetical protein